MTLERLTELFIVDFLAGTLHCRVARGGGSRVGDRAGWLNRDEYRYITVDKARLLEHRVIVSMIEGRMLDADEQVDHINGVRNDNRIENLRIVTHSENQRNRRVHRAGQPVGVTLNRGGWQSHIYHDGRMRPILRHVNRAVAGRAFEIVDTMLKAGHTFDEAKATARRECLSE